MFRLEPLPGVFPLDRNQIFDEIFTSEEHHGKISKAWWNGVHIHITTNDGKRLLTFDAIASQDSTQLLQDKESKYFDVSSSSAVVDICVSKDDLSIAYVVHRDGIVESWSYNSGQESEWSRVADLNLMIQQELNEVCSAVVCNDIIVWCQKSLSEDGHYTVCQAQMTGLLSAESKKLPSGVQSILLNDCLYCELICIQDTVIIWPRYTCNGDVFLLWTPSNRTLLLVSSSIGITEKQAIDKNAANWNSILLQNIGTLSKVVTSRIVGNVQYKESLLLISEEGKVCALNRYGEVIQKCQLSKMDEYDAGQVCCWFFYRFTLCAITSSKIIRFYCVDTGSLLYDLDVSEYGDILCPLNQHGSNDMIALWNNTTFCCLQMCDADKLQEYIPIVDAIQLLHCHGNLLQATQLFVENFCRKHGDAVTLDSSTLNFVKSPTVFLSALKKVEISNNITQNMRITNELEESLQRYQSGKDNLNKSKLNEDVADPLARILTLKQTQQDVTFPQLNTDSCHGDFYIEMLVIQLLQRHCQTDATETCNSLDVSASYFPKEVMETMMQLLTNSDHSAFGDIWSFVLSTESSLSCIPVFEIFCKLIFKEHPEKLVWFVELASKKKDKAMGVTAFTRTKEKSELYKRAQQSLPCIEDSKNCTEAVRAQVELMLHGELARLFHHHIIQLVTQFVMR
ncbi:uncharacterized protein [Ptychodera flava]|uniref:uncharacterized protein isoform X2 n=1 Tax=Ptychodera flava TaxID=63121 RepID=UPI00396A97A0